MTYQCVSRWSPVTPPKVMWAMSAEVNPQDDVVIVPNLSVMALAH
ncbi:hypothetical protein [Streptomyces sp. STR69]|nr:hypothetical protein [Streptomyces sp. STR69]